MNLPISCIVSNRYVYLLVCVSDFANGSLKIELVTDDLATQKVMYNEYVISVESKCNNLSSTVNGGIFLFAIFVN